MRIDDILDKMSVEELTRLIDNWVEAADNAAPGDPTGLARLIRLRVNEAEVVRQRKMKEEKS